MIAEALLRYRRILIVLIHLLLIPAGYLTAFGLRFDFVLPAPYGELFWSTLPYLLAIRFASLVVFGLHRGWWRHVGLDDLIALVRAITLSSGLFLGVLFMLGTLAGFPRSILFLDWLTAILILGGSRFLVRSVREGRIAPWRATTGTPTLIVGAGEAAERLLRQFRRGDQQEICVVGLIDDNPAKRGTSLHGVPVLGTTADLERVADRTGAALIVIAIPSASREDMQRLVERCMKSGVEFKIVPSIRELVDGRAKLGQLRNVEIEDLLGRDPIRLNLQKVERDLEGRVVIVTGGAGSIGSELARQVAACHPKRLILIDQAESPLYFIHLEIAGALPNLEIVPIVADITDASRMHAVFSEHRPDYVFHAAAYKHVPLMEQNVVEAVRNNVLGTLRIAECAVRHGARKFVLISTDKAVNPSSIMGATKRIAERLVLGWPSLRKASTDFRAVRFGNVLGSDGSVVPLFKRQLASGGPLTVTHPDMTRYFMTIPEAVQLVLQSAALPEAAGRIAMLDMGEPVRIVDLAENLVRLSGLEPYRDVPIVFSGMRPGEKLHEELMSMLEATVPTIIDKVRVVQTDETDGGMIERGMDRLLAAVEVGNQSDLVLATCALVPECVAPLTELRARAINAETAARPTHPSKPLHAR